MAEIVRSKKDGKYYQYKGSGDRNDKSNYFEVALPAGSNTYESTIQEMHPDISSGTRLLLKNLSNSPEASIAYLKQEYPGLEARASKNGQIEIRRPEETSWRVLDPDTGAISKDILYDIGDVGYDTLAGLLSGSAATAGGVAGLGAGGPVGAGLGAAAAGGASSAALEAARQKLGQKLGIPQEVSGADVALQGGVGALAPVAFGAGPVKGVVTEAAKGAVKKAAPVVGRAAAGLASASSGVPSEAVKAYFKRAPRIDQLADEGISADIGVIHQKMKQGLSDAITPVGKNIQEIVENAGSEADIAAAKSKFDDLIFSLENKSAINEEERQVINALKRDRDIIFQERNPLYEEEMRRYKMLKGDESKNVKTSAFNNKSQEPTETLVEPPEYTEVPDVVPAKKAFEIQERLKERANYAQKQSLQPRNAVEDQASQRMQNAAAGAYDEINSALAEATGGLSQMEKNEYAKLLRLRKTLDTHFSTPEKTQKTLSNIYSGDKKMLMETIDEADKVTGGRLGLREAAEDYAALKYFENPPLLPLSGGGTTSTSRTAGAGAVGGLLGLGAAKLSGQSPFLGAMTGSAVGSVLGGPKAIKAYIKAARSAQSATSKIPKKEQEAALLLQQYLRNKSEEE